MSRLAFEGRKKALGEEHPHTLTSLNSLARAIAAQGSYEAAEEMHRRALEGRKKALGEEHADKLRRPHTGDRRAAQVDGGGGDEQTGSRGQKDGARGGAA